jgi:hypothetical protein
VGQSPLSDAFLQDVCDRWHEAGCNTTKLACKLRKSRTTVQHWIRAFKDLGLAPRVVPDKSSDAALLQTIETLRSELDHVRAELAKASRPHFTIRQELKGSSTKIRAVWVGDAHDSPAIPDKSRFRWIGKYIRDTKPDMLGQIGDFATLDSLNTHVPNENYSGKAKPTFMADMVSFNEALGEMDLPEGLERHCVLGNHERRLFLFEERAPEAYGMMQFELQKVFERHKWTYSPYGEIVSYGGVGFVHAALNRLGKTFGGKNAENQIANDAVHDLVIGHSHVARHIRAPKLGGNNCVQVLNLGCALPEGHIEDYAQHSLTGWTYGIADITIQFGRIQSCAFITMEELKERYAQA